MPRIATRSLTFGATRNKGRGCTPGYGEGLASNDRDEAIALPAKRNNSRYATPSAPCSEIINLLLNGRNCQALRRKAIAAYIQSS